jgi:hypothetical protein
MSGSFYDALSVQPASPGAAGPGSPGPSGEYYDAVMSLADAPPHAPPQQQLPAVAECDGGDGDEGAGAEVVAAAGDAGAPRAASPEPRAATEGDWAEEGADAVGTPPPPARLAREGSVDCGEAYFTPDNTPSREASQQQRGAAPWEENDAVAAADAGAGAGACTPPAAPRAAPPHDAAASAGVASCLDFGPPPPPVAVKVPAAAESAAVGAAPSSEAAAALSPPPSPLQPPGTPLTPCATSATVSDVLAALTDELCGAPRCAQHTRSFLDSYIATHAEARLCALLAPCARARR